MLDLSEHPKKMIGDKRGPCGCDKVSRESNDILETMWGTLEVNLVCLELR
jgi:hypothetical protein